MNRKRENKNLPFVSTVIPVRNEKESIEQCLEKLINQTYQKDKLEILVVDGISTDGTREIVTRESKVGNRELRIVIKLVDNPKGQRASALNIGIKGAKGDVIIRIDARTIIPGDYIEKCVRTLIETGADNVGGIQKPIVGDLEGDIRKSKTQETIGIALSHPFGIGNAQFRLGKKSGYVDTVYLGCFRRGIFDEVGLFDEESAVISEDSDMNQRIRDAGGKVYLDKDIVAYYYPRDNLKDLWRLYFRYGGAKAGNLIKRGKLTAWRQVVPPTFLVSLIVFPVLGIFSRPFLYLWFLVGGTYVMADFAVALYLSFKFRGSNPKPTILNTGHRTLSIQQRKLSLFWRLFLVFPTMHFSWALGFWRRLLQRPKVAEYWNC